MKKNSYKVSVRSGNQIVASTQSPKHEPIREINFHPYKDLLGISLIISPVNLYACVAPARLIHDTSSGTVGRMPRQL